MLRPFPALAKTVTLFQKWESYFIILNNCAIYEKIL